MVGRDRPGVLLRRADAAMYRAKAAGRAGHAGFEEAMNDAALERLELEAGVGARRVPGPLSA